ncbi:hypothetical protein [Streptomyces achromogenes]|uniref:hypothetical protein n=1 Tax=Streptomyces achromogenes TaxID=67255 RepID=UPI0036B9EA87
MVTKPSRGDINWDVSLNAALDDLQAQATSTSSSVSSLATTVATNGGFPRPANHGAVAWTADPATVNGGQVATNGTVALSALYVTQSVTATKLFWGITTAGATPTAGQNFVGLYDANGNRLATVNVDARISSANTTFQETINVSVSPGMYWAAWVFNAATPPTVFRGPNINAGLVNFNLPVTAARYATGATGQTALPAAISPSANAFAQNSFWAAIAN